ncbi:MAG: alginate export family protein [Polyangiaceae bacterium]|nr:alginate export family protein [Polyangiaceae bacterium]
MQLIRSPLQPPFTANARNLIGFIISVLVGISITPNASAQTPGYTGPSSATQALIMGNWHIHPTLELRTQAEYRHNPFDLSSSSQSVEPTNNQWWILSRARLGIAAERGPIRAVLELQDSRSWGESPAIDFGSRNSTPSTTARLAFAELRGSKQRASFLRIGRQEIVWGDGRLLGASDWSHTGQSLDAARGNLVLGNANIDLFASIIAYPGATPAELQPNSPVLPRGSGTQLHGVRIAYHIAPLLHLESINLARIARTIDYSTDTNTTDNTNTLNTVNKYDELSDLFATNLHAWGSSSSFSYSINGVFQFGRTTPLEQSLNQIAWAASAKAQYNSNLPWNLGLGIESSYATGQNKDKTNDSTRFQPILPDTRLGGGNMGLYAWSNTMDAAGLILLSPLEDTRINLAYRYVALAEPSDQWLSASLTKIGTDRSNEDRFLGHELDARLETSPWTPVSLVAGYGALLTGQGAKNILEASGRGRPGAQHYGYVQLTVRMQ